MSRDEAASPTLKIGLVLTGGGAKGAYQVGCLKALRRAGYHKFSAISGTSVGAMNAMLLAHGKLEAAEETWTNLRCRDIIGLKSRKLLLLPLWLISALFSEFCVAKLLKIPGSLLMPLHRVLAGVLNYAEAEGLRGWAGVTLGLLTALLFLDDWSRRIFLGWIFTTNEPLASRLASLLPKENGSAVPPGIPVYATLSRYQPGAGWFPQYVRLDRLSSEEVVDTLVQSAGFPGVFPTPDYFGRHVVDGGWTDNVPLAPLLFDPASDLDLVFVIKVDKTARRPSRGKRWMAAAGAKLGGKVAARPGSEPDDLMEWARVRWEASAAHDASRDARSAPSGDQPSDHSGCAADNARRATAAKFPRIVTVVPSRPLGSVLTGTLWFSRPKARRLIEQGEQDMAAALSAVHQPTRLVSAGGVAAGAGSVGLVTERPLGIPAISPPA